MLYVNIYLISAQIGDEKLYKIGFTKRKVEQRIKDFETGNASDFNIEQVYQCEKYYLTIEKRLHKHFHEKNVRGEWFNLDKSDTYEFIRLCHKYWDETDLLNTTNTWMMDKNFKFK